MRRQRRRRSRWEVGNGECDKKPRGRSTWALKAAATSSFRMGVCGEQATSSLNVKRQRRRRSRWRKEKKRLGQCEEAATQSLRRGVEGERKRLLVQREKAATSSLKMGGGVRKRHRRSTKRHEATVPLHLGSERDSDVVAQDGRGKVEKATSSLNVQRQRRRRSRWMGGKATSSLNMERQRRPHSR